MIHDEDQQGAQGGPGAEGLPGDAGGQQGNALAIERNQRFFGNQNPPAVPQWIHNPRAAGNFMLGQVQHQITPNIADTQAIWSRAFAAGTLYRSFVLGRLRTGIFSVVDNPLIIPAAVVFSRGRILGTQINEDEIDALAIGEVLFPNMTNEYWLQGDAAQTQIKSVMLSLMDRVQACLNERYFGDIEGRAYFIRRVFHVNGQPALNNIGIFNFETLTAEQNWANYQRFENGERIEYRAHPDIATALAALHCYAYGQHKMDPRCDIRCISTMAVAICKHGTTSPPWQRKVEQALSNETSADFEMYATAINRVYDKFRALITEESVQVILARWLSFCQNGAMRIRLVIEQASRSGLTGYYIIDDAIEGYPDFNWPRLITVCSLQAQLTRWVEARRVVHGRPFYGFNTDLGPAKSTLFKGLVSVCAYVLVSLSPAHHSLRNYKGKNDNIPQKPRIDELIAEFENRAGQPGGDFVPSEVNVANQLRRVGLAVGVHHDNAPNLEDIRAPEEFAVALQAAAPPVQDQEN